MPFDGELAIRAREILEEHGPVDERKMFGGIAFMFKGYMCCGVLNDDLVARLGPEGAERALKKGYVRPMDFTGRPMKGYVFVGPAGVRTETMLRSWIRSCIEFVDALPAR
ncbi:MAG TPA: TfoX/Sxy family protein [Actinomycetota bacterium]|nr:TfoX/Sxy family protein [Actinomycetota bacterium]